MNKIYLGNLPFSASEAKVHKMFEQHGTVHSVKLITNHVTRRVRGFGFVEMEQSEAKAAIDALNGSRFGGRTTSYVN